MYRETEPPVPCETYYCYHGDDFLWETSTPISNIILCVMGIGTLFLIISCLQMPTYDKTIFSSLLVCPYEVYSIVFSDLGKLAILYLNVEILERDLYKPLSRDLTGETLEHDFVIRR